MSKINNPHDKVFKSAMTDVAIAKSFLENYLPDAIKEQTDWSTLHLSPSSFVDSKLEERASDLLYRAKISGNDSYFYILIEHQSSPDISMPFRLLEYQVKIWRQHLQQDDKRKKTDSLNLPVIYPLVYYTGNKNPYTYSTDLFDCFVDSKSAKHYLFKPFQLIDLTQIPDDQFKKNDLVTGLMLIQKHIHKRNVGLIIHKMFEQGIWIPILKHDGEYLFVLLKYITEMGEIENPEEFFDKLAHLVPEEEKKVMTIAEHFEKRGFEKGIHQVAEKLLKLEQPLSLVKKATGLSESELLEIQKTLH